MRYLLALSLLLANLSASHAESPGGHWQGAIELPNGELPILVTLEAPEGGAWTGSIDIPAQGLRGFALSNVSVQGDKVHFEMDGIPGQPTFDGQLADSGAAIRGSFQQGPQSLSFALERSTEETSEAPSVPDMPKEPVAGEGAEGEWMGRLDAGPMKLRLVLKVEAAADGALAATFDSVDQNVVLDVDSISLDAGKLAFAIERVRGSFEGKMNDDGSAVEGTWSQAGRDMPLTFHRLAEPFALNRPQTPQAPFPYAAREVTFRNADADITLAGTLITPLGEGPFPAVLLVTGSGPQDRDESIMGHKPFWVIADYLARRGIASLRYDDRGAGESEGNHLGSTVEDFTSDAAAGLDFLDGQPKIRRDAIGIVGHSEGGLHGPRLAATRKGVDFLVLLAPPGEPLDALLVRQGRDILQQRGVDAELIARALASQTEDLELIKDLSIPTGELIEKLRASAAAQKENFTAAELAALEVDEAAIEQGIQQTSTPWFRSLLREDPADHLKQIKIPVLSLFAEKDLQVAAEVNAKAVKSALTAAGNEDYEIRILPGLNHLFQHSETGAVSEYGELEETFAPDALKLIGDWIEARFRG